MKTEKKIKYYQLRAEGKKQKEAAELLGVSERTCRRWEQEARSFSEDAAETAKKLYGAKLVNQTASTTAIFAMLESEAAALDFAEISPAKKLDLLLKYGRRLDELENKAPASPEALKLDGLDELDEETAKAEILKMQTKLFNMAAAGEITDEQARKKIALLTELRKSIDANGWG